MANSRYRIWEDIAAVLRAEIASGQWQPDQVLPSQTALAERFAVQPMTIGKALQQLTAEGLLYAPHGLRERRVAAERPRSHRVGGFFDDPAWSDPHIDTAYLRVEDPPPTVHAVMPDAEKLLRWTTHQWDGPELVAISDAWYYPASWLMEYAVHPTPIDFYRRLAEQHQTTIAGFRESVQARVATSEERRTFKEPGKATLTVFVIHRQAVTADHQVLEYVTLVDRATRYILEYWTSFTPSKE
jgi:DNA-binding GntR family transcriptional regulator